MDESRDRADTLLEEALERTGARDPRDFYRSRLREIKNSDPGLYEQAVEYYQNVLVPGILEGSEDPLAAWTEYGRTLAQLTAAGRTVTVDPTGRATAYEAPPPTDALVLHVPEQRAVKALLVALPTELSSAQRATYDWLVAGRHRLRSGQQEVV